MNGDINVSKVVKSVTRMYTSQVLQTSDEEGGIFRFLLELQSIMFLSKIFLCFQNVSFHHRICCWFMQCHKLIVNTTSIVHCNTYEIENTLRSNFDFDFFDSLYLHFSYNRLC